MILAEYHDSIQCKIRGTWNLHNGAESLDLQLDSYTLLSSLSGIKGGLGQANYAAANVFLDSFASWRQARGRPACSIATWASVKTPASRSDRSGIHIKADPYPAGTLATPPMVTGLVLPQPEDSILRKDARFSPLFTGHHGGSDDTAVHTGGKPNADVQALVLLLRTESAEQAAKIQAMVDVVSGCFMRVLRPSDPMDPGRPISVYRADSLAAVEVRNWIRTELGALVTTLDIMSASSLTGLCEKILGKLVS
ncbi:hypothetical protein PG996_005091 [Apiospora saccharicola]|uniref:Carrier domain-containing protein n=1 Tax=Apiospora saccharicola TaxID=335842 RepID=A0ABR1VKI2_9PEZI